PACSHSTLPPPRLRLPPRPPCPPLFPYTTLFRSRLRDRGDLVGPQRGPRHGLRRLLPGAPGRRRAGLHVLPHVAQLSRRRLPVLHLRLPVLERRDGVG